MKMRDDLSSLLQGYAQNPAPGKGKYACEFRDGCSSYILALAPEGKKQVLLYATERRHLPLSYSQGRLAVCGESSCLILVRSHDPGARSQLVLRGSFGDEYSVMTGGLVWRAELPRNLFDDGWS